MTNFIIHVQTHIKNGTVKFFFNKSRAYRRHFRYRSRACFSSRYERKRRPWHGVRHKNRHFIFRDVAEQKHIHIKYFRIVSWLLSENVRTEETTTQAYMCFFEASFKLGRITDCDPKVGKNFQKACFDWTELGYPSYFPFVHCEFENA